MKLLKLYSFIIFCLCSFRLASQEESMLNELGESNERIKVTNAFKSPRVINAHSMEMLAAGALDFRILHRFGKINQGYEEFFGLDNASMRMSFDYGVSKNLTVGIGRSTFKKELDGFIKYRIIQQSKGNKSFPVSILWVSGMLINTQKEPYIEATTDDRFSRRLSYTHQIIIGRKFNENFSLQLSPMMIHRNLVYGSLDRNNIYAVNLGARYKLSQRIALVLDYNYVQGVFLNNFATQPLSIGLDIETGGHVFQLHFSNATGMNERALSTERNGNWIKGDIQFGFNLSRVFQIRSHQKW